jgi:predicted nuclease with TOPRIM domain
VREQLEKRLQELRTEFETGQKRLEELETQVSSLRATLLRISGAIQVLEEELSRDGETPAE